MIAKMKPGTDISRRAMGFVAIITVLETLLFDSNATQYLSFSIIVIVAVMSSYLESIQTIMFWLWVLLLIALHGLFYALIRPIFPSHYFAIFPLAIAEYVIVRWIIEYSSTSLRTPDQP